MCYKQMDKDKLTFDNFLYDDIILNIIKKCLIKDPKERISAIEILNIIKNDIDFLQTI